MCGIVGILGQGPAAPQILTALKRLEYRGYDSAGVATLEGGASRARARRGQTEEPRGQAGERAARRRDRHRPHPLGDARQADRDQRPSARERTARGGAQRHHREFQARCARNSARRAIASRPRPTPRSPPSSSPTKWIRANRRPTQCLPRSGACAAPSRWCILFKGEDNLLIGARQGAPLAVGYGDGEMFLGSRRAGAGAVHRPRRLSRRGRLGDRDPRGRRVPRPRPATPSSAGSRAARPADCSPRRAIIATSWPRRFTSSPKSSATRSPITSTWARSG